MIDVLQQCYNKIYSNFEPNLKIDEQLEKILNAASQGNIEQFMQEKSKFLILQVSIFQYLRDSSCPYCMTTVCSECTFGKYSGVCVENNSLWRKIINKTNSIRNMLDIYGEKISYENYIPEKIRIGILYENFLKIKESRQYQINHCLTFLQEIRKAASLGNINQFMSRKSEFLRTTASIFQYMAEPCCPYCQIQKSLIKKQLNNKCRDCPFGQVHNQCNDKNSLWKQICKLATDLDDLLIQYGKYMQINQYQVKENETKKHEIRVVKVGYDIKNVFYIINYQSHRLEDFLISCDKHENQAFLSKKFVGWEIQSVIFPKFDYEDKILYVQGDEKYDSMFLTVPKEFDSLFNSLIEEYNNN